MGEGSAKFGLKNGFLSQNFNITSDKEVHPKKEKKLKCPLDTKLEHPSYVNQEKAIFTLLSEVEKLKNDCLEKFISTFQTIVVRCGVSFCINILSMVLNKKIS